MKTQLLVFALVTAGNAWSGYTYDIVQPSPAPYPPPPLADIEYWYTTTSNFTPNGSGYFAVVDSSNLAKPGFSSAGSFIAVPTISGNPNDYEVNSTIELAAGGGTYINYLRATSNALASSGSCTGSYLSVEVAVPSTYTSGGAAAQLNINQCSSGSLTSLSSNSIGVVTGSTLRTVVWSTNLLVYINNELVASQTVASTTGQPGLGGYGMTSPSGFAYLLIGHHDTVNPNSPPSTGLASSILPTQVSLKWQGATDDSNGIGVAGYNVSRNGTSLGYFDGAELGDRTVSAGTSYTYAVSAVDFHGNVGTATSWTVATPPASSVDPRRVGLFTTGSYWGGGGEQIDTLSGNLNFSLLLATVQARNGWSLSLNLIYNSQNWRQDSGTNWNLGTDVGYGYGWSAQLGSITPYYKGWPNGVDHYVYTDSTGAQYILNQQSGTVWSTTQGFYVWFDASENVLHFKDGSFWLMGDVSSGSEQDAGVMYPTIAEDVSGNQIVITYAAAPSVSGSANNTSGRIATMVDSRANYISPYGYTKATYEFTYDSTNHLSSVYQNTSGITIFNFTMSSGSLGPPFGTDSSYSSATTTRLASIAPQSSGGSYQFTYDSSGSGELDEVVFPWGGHLRWQYGTATYAGSRLLREVTNRYLAADSAGATEWTYPITHSDTGTTISLVHADTTIADASGNGAKKWIFNQTTSTWSPSGAWQIGLASEFRQLASTTGAAITDDTYTWTENSSANPYITEKDSRLDGVISSKTTQTLDAYGNAATMNLFPYYTTTVPTTAVKAYASSYQTGSSYLSNYVRNRLVSTTVSPSGGSPITLVTNTYDTSGSTEACSTSYPCPTSQFDTTPPVPLAYRGLLATSVTPAKTTTNTYYGYGLLYKSTGTDGSSLTNTISSTTNYAAPDTIATQSYSTALAYDAWTAITQTTGLNGETFYMTYDSYGRPATATSAYGRTTTYAYSGTGVVPMWQSKTGPDGYTLTTLDGLGRPVKVQRGPSSTSIQSEIDTVYQPCACSPLAKLQKTSMPYASGGTPVWTTYTYDGIGRTLTVQKPDGASTTRYSYSGNQTTVTDPAGKTKTFTSDVEGNLLTVVEPDPCVSTNTVTTSYTYDWMNHLVTSTMARPNMTYSSGTCSESGSTTQTRTFVYDSAGRQTSATNPENGTVTYSYNSDNTLASKHDANGNTISYTYDSLKRLTSQSGSCGASVTYGWDTDTLDWTFSASNTAGRIATIQYSDCLNNYVADTDPSVIGSQYLEEYSYTPAGDVATKRFQITHNLLSSEGEYFYPDVNLDVGYTYFDVGQLDATTVPFYTDSEADEDQPTVTYFQGYDAMGRPAYLSDNNAYAAPNGYSILWVQNVNYDAGGRRTSMQRYQSPNGMGGENFTTQTASYNANGQLATMGWSGLGGVNGTLTYTYSPTLNNGQITQMTDGVSGETLVYSYDSLKRLVSAAATPTSGSTPAAWTQTYQYDGFGNLTAKVLGGTTTAIGVTEATNRLSSSYYDSNGNMLTGVGATYTYDTNNRMVSESPISGGTTYYAYAPDGKKVHTVDPWGNETWTLWGAHGEKLGVYYLDFSGIIEAQETDVWFAGELISTWVGGTSEFRDRLGTNRYYAGGTKPYGDDAVEFATYTQDSPALQYAQARYYASPYGRFNTVDPKRMNVHPKNPGSWNAYAYANGDPVGNNDPRGLYQQGSGDSGYCGSNSYDPECSLCDIDPALEGCSDGDDSGSNSGVDDDDGDSSLSCQNWACMPAALARAVSALENVPACDDLFGTSATRANGFNPVQIIQELYSKSGGAINGQTVGTSFSAWPALFGADAVTLPTVTGTWWGGYFPGASVTIDSSAGGVWNIAGAAGQTYDQAALLLHELGHVYNLLVGSGGSAIGYDGPGSASGASDANANLVIKTCLQGQN